MPVTASASLAAGTGYDDHLERLQGSWSTVAGPRDARLLVAGNRFTFEFIEGAIYMGEFTLDSEVNPPEMDMRIEEGPDRHRGRVAKCIYLLDGEVLRWCPAEPGGDDRLTFFPSTDDDRFLSMVFQKSARRRPR